MFVRVLSPELAALISYKERIKHEQRKRRFFSNPAKWGFWIINSFYNALFTLLESVGCGLRFYGVNWMTR
jgi:hypothetical protein